MCAVAVQHAIVPSFWRGFSVELWMWCASSSRSLAQSFADTISYTRKYRPNTTGGGGNECNLRCVYGGSAYLLYFSKSAMHMLSLNRAVAKQVFKKRFQNR